MNPDLLDVDEGAAFCHVKPSTIRSWILKRRIPFVRLGRRVFLRRTDLDHLIERSVIPAQEQKRRRD